MRRARSRPKARRGRRSLQLDCRVDGSRARHIPGDHLDRADLPRAPSFREGRGALWRVRNRADRQRIRWRFARRAQPGPLDGRVRDPVRPQHDRPAQDLIRSRLPVAVAFLGFAAVMAGCGGGSAESVSPGTPPSPTGTLAIAIPAAPGTFDPLRARTAADRLVLGQIYEPLTRGLSGPYGETRQQPCLALSAESGAHDTIWRVRLRAGVRFQDGARLNASAVLENAQRWRTTAEGQSLLPGLAAVDAPRPDLVRFIFDAPDPNLMAQLASVRLGMVSPRVLRSQRGLARLANGLGDGTGPFGIHDRDAGRVLLARNPRWWA